MNLREAQGAKTIKRCNALISRTDRIYCGLLPGHAGRCAPVDDRRGQRVTTREEKAARRAARLSSDVRVEVDERPEYLAWFEAVWQLRGKTPTTAPISTLRLTRRIIRARQGFPPGYA